MSAKNLAKFYELLKTDPELKLAVKSIDGTPQEIAEKIAALSVAVHTPFTAAEYLQNASSVDDEISADTLDKSVKPDGELKEEVLEEIVGGLRHNPYFPGIDRPPL